MKRIVDHLIASGFNISEVTPDGKLHRFASDSDDKDLLAWCVVSQAFSPKTGEEFYTVLYGDWKKGLSPKEFHTLIDVTKEDKATIAKRFKAANKVEVDERNKLMSDLVNYDALVRDMIDKPFADAPHSPPAVPVGVSIHALGFKEKEYFYTSTVNRQIVAIQKFSESDMLNLAPIDYWEAVFPGSGQSRVDWTTAKSAIMEQARACGIFQPRFVRGAGVWNDSNRIVVNMGDHLVVDGCRCELGELPDTRYFYTLGAALNPLHDRPLNVDECSTLVDACSTFKWIKPDHGFLLAGALVVSRVCGALPVRPHTWITGGASTGKTTLLERLIQPVIGDSVLYVQGSTTEAGIRQSLRADAIPVVFDEFETTGQRSQENVAAIVEFLRAAWSDSNAMIIKGGSSGNASSYQARCSAIVSSIRTKLTNDADVQRFARIELQPHGSDAEHWKKLSGLLDIIDKEYGDRLFARTIGLVPVLLANFKIFKRALAGKVGARFGDQYGMLLAGYATLISDEVLTESEAASLIDAVRLADEKEAAKVTDQEDALTHMLTKKVSLDLLGFKHDFSLQEAIIEAPVKPEVSLALQRIGILVRFDFVAVASNHSELEATFFRGTRWSNSWSNSLARLDGAETQHAAWMAGKTQRSVRIPITHFK